MPVTKRMLVITKDNVLVTILRNGLAGDGYEIINTSTSGEDLRHTIYFEQPDFIIQDVMMPSLDGIGSCLQVRQFTPTPIIMLTTWETSDGMIRGLDLTSENYLTEPFNIEILKLRIRETLKRNAAAATRELASSRQAHFGM